MVYNEGTKTKRGIYMKLKISTNGKFNKVEINKSPDGSIHDIEIDFDPADLFSDLEMWLCDGETNKFCDYAKMNLSKRNKMQFSK